MKLMALYIDEFAIQRTMAEFEPIVVMDSFGYAYAKINNYHFIVLVSSL